MLPAQSNEAKKLSEKSNWYVYICQCGIATYITYDRPKNNQQVLQIWKSGRQIQ